MNQNKSLNLSIIDGSLSAIMVTLCGGIFLIGFVVNVLNAAPEKIGLLASLPFFANLIQLLGSYIIEKTGKKKSLCVISATISRSLWFLIILLPLKIFGFGIPLDLRIWVVVGVIALSSIFASLAGVAWTSWMSELVPEKIRGAYFGKRNTITSFFGMLFIVSGGKFISLWADAYGEDNPYGFIILFALGLTAGLISLFFLRKIPPAGESPIKSTQENFPISKFLIPLKNNNFRRVLVFALVWIFAINFAGPFYGVYMLRELNADFSFITLFGTAATIATIITMKIWGGITDKLGSKPVIIVSTIMLSLIPFLWIASTQEYFYPLLVVAHISSGIFMAGAGLSQFNILLKLTPVKGKSVFLALFAAITGLSGALAPVIGGKVFNYLQPYSLTVAGFTISGFHFVFLISSGLILISALLAMRIHEEGSSSPVAVILQLKNDLNPQSGIAGATDFVMLQFGKKGRNILKQLDSKSEKLAGQSEKKIKDFADKAEYIVKDKGAKIKKLLSEDED